MNFFEELKRRNVIRVAGLYGVVGWLLAQAASLMENALALPKWFDAVVVSLLLIGFPLAVVFAWVFEMTPEGLKRTAEVPQDASIAPKTGKKLDYALLAAIGLLIVVIIADRFIERGNPDAPPQIASAENAAAKISTDAAVAESDNSIAVLPFADMSSEKDQEYFSDGISEELLNVLAQVQGLQVAGRTSSFAFKGQNKDLREIGEVLNVAHILEGSVRKAGDKVRITAQLIKAKDGYHLWSQTYDRDLNDIFAVQDEISRAIVAEISPKLSGASALKPVARADIGAYDLYLLAREKMTQDGSKAAYEEAAKLLDDAIAQDPHYAPALAWRAYAETMLSEVPGGVGDKPSAEALPVIKDYADRAIAEDPASPEGLFALGSYYGQLSYTEGLSYLPKTIETLRAAVAIRPNFPQAQNDLAYFVDLSGDKEQAIGILKDVLDNDPGLRDANVTYISGLVQLGWFEEAEAALERWARIRPDAPDITIARAHLATMEGRLADAWRLTVESANSGAPDTRLPQQQFNIRSRLYDGEWIIANANQRQKALGALLLGDPKRALELVDGDPAARRNAAAALTTYIPVHYAAGDAKAVVAYYESEMKTPAAAMEAANYCGCSPLSLVLALKDAGHKDFKPLLALWRNEPEIQSAFYARSSGAIAVRADVSALEGDFASAKDLYATAMDLGWRAPTFISRDVRKFLPQDAEFDALLARMTSLINEERHKLGMPPMDVAKG